MYWKKWTISVLTMFCFILLTNQAMAYSGETHTQSLASGEMEVSAFLTSSETDYEDYEDDKSTIERKIIGLSLSHGINQKFSIFGSVGYLWDGKIDPEDTSWEHDLDKGYYVSAGARYKAYQSGQLSCHLYGKIDYTINETYTSDGSVTLQNNDGRNIVFNVDTESEIDGYEVTLGGVVNYALNDQFNAYAGISFVPLMSLTVDHKGRANNPEFQTININEDGDIDRDNQFGFKLGGQYHISQTLAVNAEANFGTETAYVLNIGKKF